MAGAALVGGALLLSLLPGSISFASAGALGPYLGGLPLATYDLSFSFLRMLLAYALALAFALGYGYLAATNRVAEKVLLPVLDILQSVPILGFFPVAVLVLVALTPGSDIGANFASIFLIFTSMSWNMAFGVYESVKAIPPDMMEATASYGVTGSQRVRKVLLPAMVNRLVYNSILSWTGGWYFLVAAEVISTENKNISLPGIGSYLLGAAANNNTPHIIDGIIVLVILIAILDRVVWHRLGIWAEKFRFDMSPSGEATEGTSDPTGQRGPMWRVRNVVARGLASGASVVRAPLEVIGSVGSVTVARFLPKPAHGLEGEDAHPRRRAAFRYGVLGAALIAVWLLMIYIIVNVYGVFSHPISGVIRTDIDSIPLALAFSGGRLAAAYLLSLGISLGLALWLYRRPKAARAGLPVIQIIASVPATALFPLFLFTLEPKIGLEPTVVIVLMTGMIWYVFFNILSGLRNIPPDLEEAARSYGLKGFTYYRRLVFPGIFAAFVTGSITAFGGGWNTLILAEYLTYGTPGQPGYHQIQVLGIGELIDKGIYPVPIGIANGAALAAAALLTMVIAVITVNELFWKPMYRKASGKYRYD